MYIILTLGQLVSTKDNSILQNYNISGSVLPTRILVYKTYRNWCWVGDYTSHFLAIINLTC